MDDLKRRELLLYVVAAGVGTAYAIRETRPEEAQPIPAIGGDRLAGEGPRRTPEITPEAAVVTASTLAGIDDVDIVAQIEFISGNNRDYGVHVTYGGSLPIDATGDGYVVSIVESLGDETDPGSDPQFVYVVGANRDYGAHVKHTEDSGSFSAADGSSIAFADVLSALGSPSDTPRGDHVYGNNRDYGTHVET